MGFWDFLRGSRSDYPVRVLTPTIEYVGGDDLAAVLWSDVHDLTPSQMWAQQPHLRTVVSFLARNIAQLGVHVFERVTEDDRRRDRTSPLARTLLRPNADMTRYDLMFALVGDKALYDTAYWHVARDAEAASGWSIRRLPPAWVKPVARDVFGVDRYRVTPPNGRPAIELPASEVLSFSGYHPTNPRRGSPTVEALKETLQEQIEASRYRNQVWKRGGRVSSVIQRPKDAPEWSDAAREAFREDWYAKYTGQGQFAGGTPLLEDGMTLQRIDFSAADQQWVEGVKLSFATVAAAFHVNPTMVGLLDNANYSNVREFRRMLYGDTLGPLITEIEDRINTFLLPMLGMDAERMYAELNIAEKLQGSFEEQAKVMSTLVGRPIMSADEGRARFNLAAMGGDAAQLVTPLNVLIGGQASPRDSAPPKSNADGSLTLSKDAAGVHVKARAPKPYEDKHREVLAAFFRRQAAVVKSRLGLKAAGDFWDAERWDGELSDDLYRLSVSVTKQVASSTLDSIGYSPDAYDPDRTLAWLREVADRSAKSINATTLSQIEDALGAEDPQAAVTSVYDVAEGQRSGAIAAGAVTLLSSFASHEAAYQVAGDVATKTWVTGANPRPEHAAMNGETVPLSENFSNGAAWPGDGANLGADDLAGCNCDLVISIP